MTLSTRVQSDLTALGVTLIVADDFAGRDSGLHPDNFGAAYAVCPQTTGSVASIVAFCAEHQIGIVPHGGRTGLAGGATSRPGQIVLMMERMNAIREIDVVSGVAIVDAGVTLAQLEEEVAQHGLTVGIDLAARGSCTIGGMVATNAGGSEAFRNGVMRHRVLGIEAVLPNGTVLSDLRQVIKANEGYDVKQLLIGSEGTLGVVTGVAVKLEAATGQRKTILAATTKATSALALFNRLRRAYGAQLLAAEIMWRDYFQTTVRALNFEHRFGGLAGDVFVIFEVEETQENDGLLEVLADSLNAEEIIDAVLAKSEQERLDIWSIREQSFLIDKEFPDGCWFDISIPLSKLDSFVHDSTERLLAFDPALAIFVMGHLGDGNLHYTIAGNTPVAHRYSDIAAVLYRGLTQMGGSFSAEHGIGVEKREALKTYGDPGKIALMRAIKKAIDPQNIMNPGKLLLMASDQQSAV